MQHRFLQPLLAAAVLVLTACGGSGSAGSGFADEPALETPQATLDKALICTDFTHPDKPPVLLVHGTFTSGFEQYNWTYLPLLVNKGFDVCTITYPDRGLGDMQISAEYVVNALRSMHARSGRKVAMIGHSQGVAVPRWAIKWWPSAREAVEDFVMQAGPVHGTQIADPTTLLAGLGLPLPNTTSVPLAPFPEVFFQFPPYSKFIAATNAGDETPGDISYTALYTLTDELVQPATPVPTAAVDFGQNNPKVTNILLQDVCPGHIVDHVTIGTTDTLAFALTLDAISNPGPANFERAGGAALCSAPPIDPQQIASPDNLKAAITILQMDASTPPLNPHLATAEPPLKPYAH